jgi:hypothetical protein
MFFFLSTNKADRFMEILFRDVLVDKYDLCACNATL